MGATTRLALLWFGEGERTTATAIATTANGLGTTIGFLNPQWLAPTASDIPNIFWFSLVLAVLPVVCALFYLPVGPPSPPSAAAAANSDSLVVTSEAAVGSETSPTWRGVASLLHDGTTGPADPQPTHTQPIFRPAPDHNSSAGPGWLSRSVASWLQSLGHAGRNRSFVLLVVAASVISGASAGWQGTFQSTLGNCTPYPHVHTYTHTHTHAHAHARTHAHALVLTYTHDHAYSHGHSHANAHRQRQQQRQRSRPYPHPHARQRKH